MLPRAPGPKPLPLLGHLPWLLRDAPGFLAELSRRYGDVVAFRGGMRSSVFINHPQLIARLVRDRTCLRSSETRRALSSFLGSGLLSMEGSPHLRHRRLMAPAFHRERLRAYGELMIAESYAELERWKSGETRELTGDMMRLTFAIVSKALFSADTRDDARDVGAAMQELAPWVVRGAQLAGLFPEWVPILYPPRARAAIVRLKRVVTGIVARRRAQAEDRGDLLSMLLAARDEDGSGLSDEDVCAEALTLLLAGHETTANTLNWAWYLLMQHPEVEDTLAEELRRVVGDRPLRLDDLPQLGFVEQVINETLRLYPTAWVGDRVPQQEIELGGFAVPAGTKVVFSVYVTQRDARFFPDPERFDPGRFSAARLPSIPEGAFLPFGAGVHMCIGNAFAAMEARVILATMAQRFALHRQPGARAQQAHRIVLNLDGPFLVQARARA